LAALHVDHPLVTGLVVDGLIAGVGMLLTFVPLMAVMFVLLALLEDSGYLARAAVVTDRTMRALGLPGRAFLPLIVGFGCNVPAIAATRVLGGAKQRVLTALLVPFTSCSARLTVYVLLATTFFDRYAGTVVFGMYLLSILLIVGVGLVLRRTLWRSMLAEPLLLDLPPYQRPTARVTWSVTWTRLRGIPAHRRRHHRGHGRCRVAPAERPGPRRARLRGDSRRGQRVCRPRRRRRADLRARRVRAMAICGGRW
jgi:ferrous iron transport protein B